jgi:hypothetical protein
MGFRFVVLPVVVGLMTGVGRLNLCFWFFSVQSAHIYSIRIVHCDVSASARLERLMR